VLLFHCFLPEGVIVGDVNMFAAMIEEAYNPPTTLLLDMPDENGNQRCHGLIGNGRWEWAVAGPEGQRAGARQGWVMTLGPERDGQRQATMEVAAGEQPGFTLATFPIRVRPSGQNPLLVDPIGGVRYRRPPATVSFDDLGRQGLRRALFVNGHLPEGVTACDIDVFAAMIEEAYHTPGALHMHPDLDEHGNEQCTGIGAAGTWDWLVIQQSEPGGDGLRYQSARQIIYRMLFAPEKDGVRLCTAVPGYSGHQPEDKSPVTFTIRTRPRPDFPGRDEQAWDPADATVSRALSGLADQAPAAAGLLRLLVFLAPEPLPLGLLLAGERAAGLPIPEAAASIGPLLGNLVATGDAAQVLRRASMLSPADDVPRPPRPRGRRPLKQLSPAYSVREVVPTRVRVVTRDRLTAEESAQWRQAAAVVVEAAVPADPQVPASWPAYAGLLPHARAALDLTSDGMGRMARYLGESGRYPAAHELWRLIADVCTADDAHGPGHPRTLAARRELARWTGMAGDAASARDWLAALLPVTEGVQGPGHPDTLAVRRELARWTGEAGDVAGARDQCVALWPVIERALGGNHPDALAVCRELARWTGEAGDAAEAQDQLAALLPVTERVLGSGHPRTLATRSSLAYWTEQAAGRPAP
jgi:hypothetical protein